MTYLNWIISYIKAHWVTIFALLTAVWTYAQPTVLNFITNHPQYSFWFGLASTVVAFYITQRSATHYQDKSSTPSD